MEWVETTAKTLEEAKEAALASLGIGPDDAEFEVLEEPRSGLFGLRRGSARVRARVRPAAVRPKQDRRQRRREGGKGERGGRNGRQGGEGGNGQRPSPATARPQQVATSAAPANGAAPERGGDDESADGAESSGEAPRRARRRGGRGRGGQGRPGNGSAAAAGEVSDQEPGGRDDERADERGTGANYGAGNRGADVNDENETHDNAEHGAAVAVADVQAAAETFGRGLLDAFGIAGVVSTTVADHDIELRIEPADGAADGVGLLIGPGGRTLSAVQELARVAAQRRLGDHDTRLRVDVAGYRERRRVALEKFAHHVAALVQESGVARSLDPMPSPDRKVIHDVLATIDGVSSRSEGEDPNRRIVVSPATSD